VLEAIGMGSGWETGSLRLTVGKQNDLKDVDVVLEMLPDVVATLRKLSLQYA
jgi:cysteine sulfinate desulfinase/cysteine desulfurase-like protein